MEERDILVEGWDYYYVTKQGSQPGFTVSQVMPVGYDIIYVFHPTEEYWTPDAAFSQSYVLASSETKLRLDEYIKRNAS